MGKRLTIQEIEQKILGVHGGKITLIASTYIDTNHKAIFILEDGTKWEAWPRDVMRGCGKPQKLTFEKIISKLKSAHGDNITVDMSTWNGTENKCVFIHKKYGKWEAFPSNVFNGTNHPDTWLENVKNTNLRNFGTEFASQSKQAKEKFTQTSLNKYGVTHPNKTKEAQEKRKKTCLKKYGVECVLQADGIKQKVIDTLFKNHGVTHPSHSHIITLKQAKSNNNSIIKSHWKTGEELICIASYESKVVDYLNSSQIDFEWQPKTFVMPNGKTYRPDLYLVDEQVWIEIKGYMRGDCQAKWDWFKSEHPTAELWNKEKLKEIGIL